MAALANLLLLGKEGYRVLLGHAVEMAEVLRERLESHPDLTVLNGDNVGPVTLFRAYPDGVDTFSVKQRERSDPAYREQLQAHNEYNRRIFELVHSRSAHRARRGAVADQLLPPERFWRPDRGAEVVRAVAVHRRKPHGVDRAPRAGRSSGGGNCEVRR